ncbi:MAG: hypothetical protein LIP16_01405 [Clostridium sp.]|nr:hypothetical protein [Clostridium sp.]
MKIRKVLGGFAWVMLAAVLIMANAMTGSAGEMSAGTGNASVSSVME